jgi:hypothetical protein
MAAVKLLKVMTRRLPSGVDCTIATDELAVSISGFPNNECLTSVVIPCTSNVDFTKDA